MNLTEAKSMFKSLYPHHAFVLRCGSGLGLKEAISQWEAFKRTNVVVES